MTTKQKETVKLGVLLTICLILLIALVIVLFKTFSETKPATEPQTQYIEISTLDGMKLADTKALLDGADITYEIIPSSSKTPNKVEKIEYVGKEENGKIFIEVGTTVKLYANEVSRDKIIYLTFDDGPTRDNTLDILDALDERGIKATFFVLGKNVKGYPDRISATVERGHLVGCHSYSHKIPEIYESISTFLAEIEQYEEEMKSALGEEAFASISKVIRFPGGTVTNSALSYSEAVEYLAVVRQKGYKVYDWTALTGDAEGYSTMEEFLNYMTSGLTSAKEKNNPLIVLLHDKWSTNEALPEILDYLVAEGYYFDTIDNCPEFTFVEN